MFDDIQSNTESYADSFASDIGSISGTPAPKKRNISQVFETNEILREFLAHWPKQSDFVPLKPADDVQQFFDSMISTVRKLTPVAIARIKMKVAEIVGEEELAWAENTSLFYADSFAFSSTKKEQRPNM